MNQFYQQQSPLLPRRATEPVTLAPAASMIDPNLENHRIHNTQIAPNYARYQMQHASYPAPGGALQAPNGASVQTNGYPNTIHSRSNSNSNSNGNGNTTGNSNMNANGNGNGNNRSSARALPSTEVNESSIEEAYVQFIMYCNPSIPTDKDFTELRKGMSFQSYCLKAMSF